MEIRISEDLDLNAGMKPIKRKFLSWEAYKETWENQGRKADYKMYLEDKSKFLEDQEKQVLPLNEYEKMIFEVPLRVEQCRIFREMMLSMRDKEPIWASNHHCNCSACQIWWATVYKTSFLGCDLFNSGI